MRKPRVRGDAAPAADADDADDAAAADADADNEASQALALTRVLESEEGNRLRDHEKYLETQVVPGLVAHTNHLHPCELKRGDLCKFTTYFQASLSYTVRPSFK